MSAAATDASVFWDSAFDPSRLENSPSRAHLSLDEELRVRSDSVKVMALVGREMSMPQAAIATAATYFHQFYMRNSFKAYEKHDICQACLYLASKTEECRKSSVTVARTYFYIRYRKQPPQKDSVTVKQLAKRLVQAEVVLLQSIEFSFQVSHPYEFLMSGIKTVLHAHNETNPACLKSLSQIAWYFVNDSLLTPIGLFHPPQHVALACISLAFRFIKVRTNTSGGKCYELADGWWTQFDPALKPEVMDAICSAILKVFEHFSPRLLEKPAEPTQIGRRTTPVRNIPVAGALNSGTPGRTSGQFPPQIASHTQASMHQLPGHTPGRLSVPLSGHLPGPQHGHLSGSTPVHPSASPPGRLSAPTSLHISGLAPGHSIIPSGQLPGRVMPPHSQPHLTGPPAQLSRQAFSPNGAPIVAPASAPLIRPVGRGAPRSIPPYGGHVPASHSGHISPRNSREELLPQSSHDDFYPSGSQHY
eukprot:17102_1